MKIRRSPVIFLRSGIAGTIIIAMLSVLSLLSGCTQQGSDNSARKKLTNAVTGLSGKDSFRFTGKTEVLGGGEHLITAQYTEGYLVDHKNLYIQTSAEPLNKTKAPIVFKSTSGKLFKKSGGGWVKMNASQGSDPAIYGNPMLKLKQALSLAERIHYADNAPKSRTRNVVELQMEPQKYKEEMVSQLRQKQKAAIDSSLNDTNLMKQISSDKAAEYRKEVKAAAHRSEQAFDEMIKTLRVQSVLRVTLDRVSGLPVGMKEHTVLHYQANGGQREEAVQSVYTFQDYDKAFNIE